MTLLAFWVRYLPRHDWLGTGIQVTSIILATGFGALSYGLARRTLRGQKTKFVWENAWQDFRTYLMPTITIWIVVLLTLFA